VIQRVTAAAVEAGVSTIYSSAGDAGVQSSQHARTRVHVMVSLLSAYEQNG
jgi:hypothetical protein